VRHRLGALDPLHLVPGACAGHLGWLFSGKDRFFGLILDRLVEAAGHFDDGRSP